MLPEENTIPEPYHTRAWLLFYKIARRIQENGHQVSTGTTRGEQQAGSNEVVWNTEAASASKRHSVIPPRFNTGTIEECLSRTSSTGRRRTNENGKGNGVVA